MIFIIGFLENNGKLSENATLLSKYKYFTSVYLIFK